MKREENDHHLRSHRSDHYRAISVEYLHHVHVCNGSSNNETLERAGKPAQERKRDRQYKKATF